jgi:hypothetical protein
MKITELKKGQKLYHAVTTNRVHKPTGEKVRETKTIFVVEVNQETKKVCASINGAPAQWYDGNFYSRWKLSEQDPRIKESNYKRTRVTRIPTRKQQILSMLDEPGRQLTCVQICKRIVEDERLSGNVALYLSGSISSILRSLVLSGELECISTARGPRGGNVYAKKLEHEQPIS